MTKRDLPAAPVASRHGVRSDVVDTAFQRWVPDVRAMGGEDEPEATISILDVIGEDFWGEGVTAKRIAGALRQIGEQDVTVMINSPGGDVFEGLAIYNMLREHKGEVTVKILGLAASAASVIAMAGDTIQIGRAGFLMIHNAWVVTLGDKNDLREVADWLEPFDASAIDIYAHRTGLEAGELRGMLDRETWIGGTKAIDLGFADELLASDEVQSTPEQSNRATQIRAERQMDAIMARAGVFEIEGPRTCGRFERGHA